MVVEYQENNKIAYYNGERFTRDDRTGYYLSARRVPETGKRMRLHKYVWLIEKGRIPEGCQIHHIDQDKSHNDIENLACLSEHDHLSYHSQKYADEHRDEVIQSLDVARISANKWHGSEAGHKWHKEQYKRFKDRIHVEHEYICQQCGKPFTSKKVGSKFCSNNCKCKARRISGVDNIKAICPVCGKEFVKNKYSKTITCGNTCGGILRKKH